MKFEAEIQKNTIDVAKILIFALFWSKNHNICALVSQKAQQKGTFLAIITIYSNCDFEKRRTSWNRDVGGVGGALLVTILWILFSQIPFLLYEGYPYFFVWKGGRFLPNLKCPHHTVSSFVTTGGGAQWAKLMGQARQLNIALKCEDYGLPSPINASSLWWSMSGEGRDWVRPFLRGEEECVSLWRGSCAFICLDYM